MYWNLLFLTLNISIIYSTHTFHSTQNSKRVLRKGVFTEDGNSKVMNNFNKQELFFNLLLMNRIILKYIKLRKEHNA